MDAGSEFSSGRNGVGVRLRTAGAPRAPVRLGGHGAVAPTVSEASGST